ncbi:MAG: Glycine betaine-binding protein OpuAC [Prochlorococcus marinus str. MIT 9215]|nr:MAG: Glycine betaine-binding protein OpuAC [Prochlorococcus marinus str. MIT 9215]
MTINNRWKNRALIIAGGLIALLSMQSILRLSTQGDANKETASEKQGSPKANLDGSQNKNEQTSIKIGWTAWSDADVVSLMAEKLIERHLDQPVDRVMADIGIQYEAVARGDLDMMLMAWLPTTHQLYWKKVRDRVINLGPMYTGRLGWVVPAYVPKEQVGSINDLAKPKIAQLFSNKIQGIDPGSGLMQASEKALKDYSLSEMELVSSSGAAMTAVLDRSIRDNRWVVVTSWTPHWMFARYQLRFLQDPKQVLGGIEGIHAITRIGLDQDHPKVVAFLSRFRLPENQLDALLLAAQESSTEQAVNNYLANNQSRVKYWMTGTIEEAAPTSTTSTKR